MAILFHEKMAEYINSKGINILSMVRNVIEPMFDDQLNLNKGPSYLQHKPTIDLTGKAEFISTSTVDESTGKIFKKYKLFGDRKIGLERDGIIAIHDVVNQIQKEAQILEMVTKEFLFEKIFDWTISQYEKKEEKQLSHYILDACSIEIKTYNIYIPILYLEANADFEIGQTRFCYLSDAYIRKLSQQITEEKRSDYIESFKKFKGQLLGRCKITAQKEKAIEIARKQIIEAIDVLRLLSPTVELPEVKIYYDIDFRNIYQIQSATIIQLVEEEHFLSMNFNRIPVPFVIDQMAWDLMNKMQLKQFHIFLKQSVEKTELENLILKALSNFSKAIANHDLHERVMQVFTVLESLLLPNEDSQILDSICKYLPKFISNKIEERQLIVGVVKEMYKIRSAMVHHAIKKDFDLNSLSKLCISCRALIITCLHHSYTKKTKQEILKEIDDRLMSA